MIIKINKDNYILVKSDLGKRIHIKGDNKHTYSEATEYADKPKEWEEVDD